MKSYHVLPGLCLLMCMTASAAMRYVDLNNPAPAVPFTSWATAATTIQDAVDAAVTGDVITVTNGLYATGGRAVHGTMTNRVVVDKAVHLLSVNGPQFTVIQGYEVPGTTNGDGAIRCVYLTDNSSLSGFTLTRGATRSAGDYTFEQSGGGVLCESTAVVVSNCLLIGNSASYGGGSSYGTLNNCLLIRNSAYNPSTFCGGGGAQGGILINCIIRDNWTTENGGGAQGAALINCTVVGNRAGWGGGVANGRLTNSIVYFNSANYGPNFYYNGGSHSEALITFCCTTPQPYNAFGNITANPLLVDMVGGNCRLQTGSPCFNAGDNSNAKSHTDFDGDPRIVASVVDMGAYEFQAAGLDVAPYILIQPTNQMAPLGGRVAFALTIGGTEPLYYQWNFEGVNLDGETNATLTLTNLPLTQAGSYSVTITNLGGAITSSNALLTVTLTRYVDINVGAPLPPYTNWATAATNIQDAIDVSKSGDEIVVSNGVYATGGRAVVGLMTNRVAVDKSLRLRSVNGPQFTIIQGRQMPGTTNGDGAVRCVYLTNGASLSGFTLTNGATRTNGYYTGEQSGGGVLCESASAVISNCVLTGNSAVVAGGGVAFGTLSDCALIKNEARDGGGAFSAMLDRCIVRNNTAQTGGGIYECTLNNCLVVSNTGPYLAGGAYGGTLNNCTVVGNTGIGAFGYYWGHSGTLCTLSNTIVYYNTPENLNGFAGLYSMNYSCSTPAWYGSGNITNEPMFVNLAAGDFRLQPNSPCVDTGINNYVMGATDFDGAPRIRGSAVDMGAYEFQGSQPILKVAKSAGDAVLSWPQWASDFLIQQIGATPMTSAGWSNLVVDPIIINNENSVSVPLGGTQRLFRLFKP